MLAWKLVVSNLSKQVPIIEVPGEEGETLAESEILYYLDIQNTDYHFFKILPYFVDGFYLAKVPL